MTENGLSGKSAASLSASMISERGANMEITKIWNIRPLASADAVIRGKDFRITVLTDRLLRLEYEENGCFCDTATQMALCREFPVPAFTVADSKSGLIVETAALRLCYDKCLFSYQGLTVTMKGAYGPFASVWHYGEPNRTLGGTARTLDEANVQIPLEDGLTSRQGYAVLDDSASMGMDDEGNLLAARPHGVDLYFFGYGLDFRIVFGISCVYPVLCRLSPALPWATGGAGTILTRSRDIRN